jgi:TRAP-type transport system large permease protein
MPAIHSLDIDPVWFGVIMMCIVTLGSMAPPVGVVMYTTYSIIEEPLEEYVKETLPFYAAILVVYALIFIFPDICLFLPNMVFG